MKRLRRTYAFLNRLRTAWYALTTRDPFLYVECRPEVAIMLMAHDPEPEVARSGVVRMRMGGFDVHVLITPRDEEGPPDRSDGPQSRSSDSDQAAGGSVVSGPWGARPSVSVVVPEGGSVSVTGAGSGSGGATSSTGGEVTSGCSGSGSGVSSTGSGSASVKVGD